MKNIKEMIIKMCSATAARVWIGVASVAVIGGAVTAGVVFDKAVSPEPIEEVMVEHNTQEGVYSVSISPDTNVSAESIYAKIKNDYSAEVDSVGGMVLLSNAGVSEMEVTFGDGSKAKDFVDAGDFDETIICRRGSQEETYNVLLTVKATSTETKSSTTDAVIATDTVTAITTDTSTTTISNISDTHTTTTNRAVVVSGGHKSEVTEDSSDTVDDVITDSNSSSDIGSAPIDNEPQVAPNDNKPHTSPQTVEPATESTTVKPQIPVEPVTEPQTEPQTESEIPSEPVTEPQPEPATEPQTEAEVVHGDGCQYFQHKNLGWCYCNEGNDGYPDWFDGEDKDDFKYAFNEALKYTTKYNAVTWAMTYVDCLRVRDKSEVFIGDPTDGEASPNVWVLYGYTEDGDEIWLR